MGTGHGHSHRAGGDQDFEVAALPRTVLLAGLVLAGIATMVGMFLLRPDGARAAELKDSVAFAAPGTTFPQATVTRVEPACDLQTGQAPDGGTECGQVRATVDEGASAGQKVRVSVPPEVTGSGLVPGDRIQLLANPAADGAAAQFSYFGTERGRTLWILLIVFVVAVVAVARLRGLLALVGLVFAGFVILQFMLPALLVGESGLLVGIVGSAAIMYVVLYMTHGLSIRTSAALAGTLAGLAATAVIGLVAVDDARLTGVTDEGGGILTAFVGDISFQGLLTCAIIVAGLGVLNDVTITQASAVWELRGAAPHLSRRSLFTSGMRIGRDHIASTIYTIVFAYTGTALLLLLVVQLYDRPLLDLLATEEIAQEIVRTLVTSIGLVLAVPLTTAIAALTVPGPRVEPVSAGGPPPAAR